MKPSALKITVITVAYNAAATIAETIRSVAAQDYPKVEHIVIDGASLDGTAEIARRTPGRVSRLVSEPDDGLYDAMNKGLALATGDVVGFLNADDVYAHSGVLNRVAESLSNANVDACYADLVYVAPSDPHRIVRYWRSRPYEDGLFEKGWMPAHPTFYVHRSVYERLGGFDLAYKRQADFELTMRLMRVHKIRTVYVPEVWVRMRSGGLSNSSIIGVLKGNWEAYRACRAHGLRVTPFFIFRKIAGRIPQFFARPG